MVEAAAVSNVPGWAVFGAVVAGYVGLFALALWPGFAAATTETSEDEDLGDLDREK